MRPARQPHSGSGVVGWWRNLRRRRAHPAPTTLSRYVDDDLPLHERVAVDEHVRECGPCRRLLESLAQTIRGLRSMGTREPSPRAERIVAALTLAMRESDPRQVGARPTGWRDRVRAGIRYCVQRSQLQFTVPIGLLVGSLLSLVNKGEMLLDGEIDLGMCAVCALDFLLPFLAMNVVLLATTRVFRRR